MIERVSFLGVIGTLGFESSKIVISLNYSESSWSLPMNVDFTLNHVNHYMFCQFFVFVLLFSFSLLLFFIMAFHNNISKPILIKFSSSSNVWKYQKEKKKFLREK